MSLLRSPLPGFRLPTYSVLKDEGSLLRDWAPSRTPVYFDFGDDVDGLKECLWRVHPGEHGAFAYITAVPREQYVQLLLNGKDFDQCWSEAINFFIENARRRVTVAEPLSGFQRYVSARMRTQRRF